jgi:putative hydroxymethylpyrimidine transport system substrate-binding protein
VLIYDELIYVTREALKDDPRLPRFLAAIEEATVFITNHPEEARAMFMASHVDLDDELNRVAFDLTLPRFAKRPAALDAGRYDRFAAFLKEKGLLETIPPVESYTAVVR